MHSFIAWVANGFYHSLIIYFVNMAFFLDDQIEPNGQTSGHWVMGTTVYTCALITVMLKAALITNTWTKWHFIAIPGSLVLWFVLLPLYAWIAPKLHFSTEYTGILPHLAPNLVFWAAILVVPALCLIRDLAWKYLKRMYRAQSYHHVQEIQKYNIQDYRPRQIQFQKAIRKVRQVQRMRKQRGYAFSQTDESQTRVLNAYDTTRERGRYGELSAQEAQGRR